MRWDSRLSADIAGFLSKESAGVKATARAEAAVAPSGTGAARDYLVGADWVRAHDAVARPPIRRGV